MTPRERMRDFLSGKSVDRIPNGLGGCETAGLHNLAYHRLKEAVDVQDPGNRICTFMTNAVFEPPVLEAVEGDDDQASTGGEEVERAVEASG